MCVRIEKRIQPCLRIVDVNRHEHRLSIHSKRPERMRFIVNVPLRIAGNQGSSFTLPEAAVFQFPLDFNRDRC